MAPRSCRTQSPEPPKTYRAPEAPEPPEPPEASKSLEPLQYVYVMAVILYWEDSDRVQAHIKEAQEMESVFRSLDYRTEIHPIPMIVSHDDVHNLIIREKQSVVDIAGTLGGSGLLIIHYSGHGDKGDDNYSVGFEDSRIPRVIWLP